MAKQSPQLLKGFRDYLPDDEVPRQKILNQIAETFERFGFLPMQTPALEYYDLLGGKYGEEGERLMYKFQDQGDRMVALRYDLTVPLARVVANNPDLPKPFKRYQIAPVWRADKPQKGRYREFLQCDVDVVGSGSINADVETAAAVAAAYRNLGLKNAVLKFNNRQLVDRVLAQLEMGADKRALFMRELDKIDKVGERQVLASLKERGFPDKIFASYSRRMDQISQDYAQQMQALLQAAGVSKIEFDKFLVRGLDYYTGVVYEFYLPDQPQYGSIGGGGRYDQLIAQVTGKNTPAVGVSIGLDRLWAAMAESGAGKSGLSAQVLIMNLDEALALEYLKLARTLRQAGINTDFYFEPAKLDKQFRYAEAQNIKLAVIVGPEEIKTKTANIKELDKQEQTTVPMNNLTDQIQRLLG